ncbi:MAG: CoA-binding protein, partial [Candidatus Bathyarchaeota archaeon]|nr:CoA-binding protein [Candidatus Bathyarchaeota archaeon]
MSRTQLLKQIFNAHSVAIIGASRRIGHPSHLALVGLIESGFDGKIYPINPSAREVDGIEAYPNIKSVHEPVDVAFIAVQAAKVIPILRECAEKGVKGAIINSAGFKELGTKEGTEREEEVSRIASSTGMGIIGPNCVGFHRSSMSTMPGLPQPAEIRAILKEKGNVGMTSQSGWFCGFYIHRCALRGVRFSTAISSGNEADFTTIDFLEYLGEDEDTKVITMYLEGVKDGKNFLKVSKAITPEKPIIIWKVGLTKAGSRAAFSHTGSLAGKEWIYGAVFRQTHIVQAFSSKELIDLTVAFALCKKPKGNRVGIISSPGGFAVATADACERSGLNVPRLSEKTCKELKKFLPQYASTLNPVDLTMTAIENPQFYPECMKILDSDDKIDSIIVVTGASGIYD